MSYVWQSERCAHVVHQLAALDFGVVGPIAMRTAQIELGLAEHGRELIHLLWAKSHSLNRFLYRRFSGGDYVRLITNSAETREHPAGEKRGWVNWPEGGEWREVLMLGTADQKGLVKMPSVNENGELTLPV